MTVGHDPGRTWRCLVIGGGARACRRRCRCARRPGFGTSRGTDRGRVVEASERLGGVIETVRLGDYLVERGPDMFITDKPAPPSCVIGWGSRIN
ncbi:MAG: hypothetical protein Ct9H300mP1_03720 [Planctomycetaceae bacterium]|nr:MAG: hypothetical protein Ct9H300mP1_03720 [Planctomycetaceae bacterium]